MGKVKSFFWDLLMKNGAEVLKVFDDHHAYVSVPEDWDEDAIAAFAKDELPAKDNFHWELPNGSTFHYRQRGYVETEVALVSN